MADELGLTASQARQTFRNLSPGSFHCFGPALSNEVVECVIGNVKTTHPKAGQRLMKEPPAPSSAIKKILSKLEDLPKEAEQEARTIDELKKENSGLKREATLIRKQLKENGVPEKEVVKRINAAVLEVKKERPVQVSDTASTKALRKIQGIVEKAINITSKPVTMASANTSHSPASVNFSSGNGDLSKSHQKIVNAIAYLNEIGIDQPTRVQVGVVAGYKQSGSFSNYISSLNTAGILTYPLQGHVQLTDEGRELAVVDIPEGDPTETIQNAWFGILTSPQAKILRVIISHHPEHVSREQVAHDCCYQMSGSFSNYISSLKTLSAIEYPQQGYVKASHLLFG